MLALAFHVGHHRFALRCSEVVEVVPRVALRELPRAPPWVPGSFMYRGTVAPAIDLSVLLWSVPCTDRLSTRLVVVRGRSGTRASGPVGLLCERVTEAVHLTEGAGVTPGVAVAGAPYLGEVYTDGAGMFQRLLLDELLAASLSDAVTGAAP